MPKPLKEIVIKVFNENNNGHKTVYLRAPNGRCYLPEGEDLTLQRFADEMERKFPFDEYSLKQVGRGAYNFVWAGKRPIDEAALLVGGMPLGEMSTVQVGA